MRKTKTFLLDKNDGWIGDPETAKVAPTGVVIDTEDPMEKEPQGKPPQTEHTKAGENSAEMEVNEITVPVVRLDAADQEVELKAVNIASQEVHNIGDSSSEDIHSIWHDGFEPKEEKREWIKSTEYIQEPSIEVKRAKDIEIQPLNLEFEKDDVQSKTLKEHGEIEKQSKKTPNLPSKNLTHMQVISGSQDGQIPE